ncbi:MAG: MBOAT family protein [Acidobacteria bacterium]|nr:MBOAT family protein [Acidobacteriota bacterium]
MTFNSVTFLVFFALVLGVYWMVAPRWRNPILLVSSYVFYGWWDWRFLGLLVISTLVDFTVGRKLYRAKTDRRRGQLLTVSLVVNLGILGIFKYFNFFVDGAVDLLNSLGVEANPTTLKVVLPVGISFYTFQTISYTFDIYRRRLEPTNDLIAFGTYVSYFPQLVAGPIERAQNLMPQILDPVRSFPDDQGRREAARLILVGLIKKVVLADGVARLSNEAFSQADSASAVVLVVGVVAFAIQIYGDFSGYTDIARGVSKLLGIDLMVNFTQPYLSRNITEFWRRWHISLSNWLRDYLYISLGGNRSGTLRTYRNLMITMLLGGLWHGASWNFVIWGGLHGIYLVIHKLMRGGEVDPSEPRWSQIGSILLTNVAVLFAWVFFRAANFTEAIDVIVGIVTLRGGSAERYDVLILIGYATATIALDLVERRRSVANAASIPPRRFGPMTSGALVATMLVAVVVWSGGTPVPFIYFQF